MTVTIKHAELPVTPEGVEKPFQVHLKLGRHPADGNVTIEVPMYDVQVSVALAPHAYMNPDFTENYLNYVIVTTAKRKMEPVDLIKAAALALDLLDIGDLLPGEDNQVSQVAIIYSEGFPQEPAAVARGLHMAGLLACVPCTPETFKQTVNIMQMAGIAAMAGGKMHRKEGENLGRRLSDAMPPSTSKH